jgi:hypothetical protein
MAKFTLGVNSALAMASALDGNALGTIVNLVLAVIMLLVILSDINNG